MSSGSMPCCEPLNVLLRVGLSRLIGVKTRYMCQQIDPVNTNLVHTDNSSVNSGTIFDFKFPTSMTKGKNFNFIWKSQLSPYKIKLSKFKNHINTLEVSRIDVMSQRSRV